MVAGFLIINSIRWKCPSNQVVPPLPVKKPSAPSSHPISVSSATTSNTPARLTSHTICSLVWDLMNPLANKIPQLLFPASRNFSPSFHSPRRSLGMSPHQLARHIALPSCPSAMLPAPKNPETPKISLSMRPVNQGNGIATKEVVIINRSIPTLERRVSPLKEIP